MNPNKKRKITTTRFRAKPVKRWDRTDEDAIINFLKQNRNFEKPTQRMFYTKFVTENDMDVDWKLVLYKVRNMRTVYRRAKSYQFDKAESNETDIGIIRNTMLTICWYVDDFDLLFPNEMDNYNRQIPQQSSSDDDDESSNEESITKYANDLNTNNTTTSFNEEFLNEEPTVSYFSKSIGRDILAVQTGKFNLKKQKFNKETNSKELQLEFARHRLKFEKEKFQLEIKLKEKRIDSEERLKIMELQMQERIAMKELEVKRKLKLHTIEKYET